MSSSFMGNTQRKKVTGRSCELAPCASTPTLPQVTLDGLFDNYSGHHQCAPCFDEWIDEASCATGFAIMHVYHFQSKWVIESILYFKIS